MTVTGGPTNTHLDGIPAVAYVGTNAQGKATAFIAADLGTAGVYMAQLTTTPADFQSQVTAFEAISASIKFPAGEKP
jgi:hypothetical protein